ncbi:MAG: hypothetical protein KME08_13075 [Aphanothece sp. CMT-3BRIN-NPC111]|jgi:hypothetical protein|nr:hypothetical protein [Aphanothece sp. CMT-3BRIN-NPC111]
MKTKLQKKAENLNIDLKNVMVHQGKEALIINGTGASDEYPITKIVCKKFTKKIPKFGQKYDVQATAQNNVRINLTMRCTFSGEVSEFTRVWN